MPAEESIPPLPEFLKKRLRIFLSVDIVGSTALKQGNLIADAPPTGQPSSAAWFLPITDFYRGMEASFTNEWRKVTAFLADPIVGWDGGDAPEFWKAVGDELIYFKELSDSRQVLAVLTAWWRAINSYREILKAKHSTLDLKTGIWLAGFPVTNSEIILRSRIGQSDENDVQDPIYANMVLLDQYYRGASDASATKAPLLTKDFIGPSIDTGFRLCAHATPRKMVMSIDLAYVISKVLNSVAEVCFGEDKLHMPVFYFDGKAQMKGVVGSSDYPIFWIDMLPEAYLKEDTLTGKNAPKRDAVYDYAAEYIESKKHYGLFIPYIESASETMLKVTPAENDRNWQILAGTWAGNARKLVKKSASVEALKTGIAETKAVDTQAGEDPLRQFLARIIEQERPLGTSKSFMQDP